MAKIVRRVYTYYWVARLVYVVLPLSPLSRLASLPGWSRLAVSAGALCATVCIPAVAHELAKPEPIAQSAPLWPAGVSRVRDTIVPVILTISADGLVTDVQVEASLGDDFDQAAVAAALQWTFEPARDDGVAVSAKVRAVVRFHAEDDAAKWSKDHAANAGHELTPANVAHEHEPAASSSATTAIEPVRPVGHGEEEHHEVRVIGERVTPPRSASETTRGQEVIQAAPHRTGGDLFSECCEIPRHPRMSQCEIRKHQRFEITTRANPKRVSPPLDCDPDTGSRGYGVQG